MKLETLKCVTGTLAVCTMVLGLVALLLALPVEVLNIQWLNTAFGVLWFTFLGMAGLTYCCGWLERRRGYCRDTRTEEEKALAASLDEPLPDDSPGDDEVDAGEGEDHAEDVAPGERLAEDDEASEGGEGEATGPDDR